MKINSKKSSSKRKIFIIALLIVLLVAVGAVGAYYYVNLQQQASQESDSNSPKPADSDKKQAEAIKEDPKNKETTPNTDTPAPVTPNESTGKSTVQMVASANVSGSTVYIRGGINNAVVSDGTCYAKLSGPAGQSLRKDTTLLQNASTTDCKTISISTSELAKGRWSVTLYYSSNTMEGASSEATFDIN